jgi:hypothetical protein
MNDNVTASERRTDTGHTDAAWVPTTPAGA